MCGLGYSPDRECFEVSAAYRKLDDADRRMVRELILRLQRKATGLKRKVIYEEDCG